MIRTKFLTSGVYQIKSKATGKFYIGCSNNIKARWRTHKSGFDNENHSNYKFREHVQKYGVDDFEFSVIELCEEDLIYDREEFYIKKMNPYFNIQLEFEKEEVYSQKWREQKPKREIWRRIPKVHKEKFLNKSISKEDWGIIVKEVTYKYKLELNRQIDIEYEEALRKIPTIQYINLPPYARYEALKSYEEELHRILRKRHKLGLSAPGRKWGAFE